MISASLYAADYAGLGESVRNAEKWGVESLHVDIMDGNYTTGFGLNELAVKVISKHSVLPVDIHLMTNHPSKFFDLFAGKNLRNLFFHGETEPDINSCLSSIREKGLKPGLAISPQFDPESVLEYAELVESVLLLSIIPGSLTSFEAGTLDKIRRLKWLRQHNNYSFKIAVDGGLSLPVAKECMLCGADLLVIGRALFQSPDPSVLAHELNGESATV